VPGAAGGVGGCGFAMEDLFVQLNAINIETYA